MKVLLDECVPRGFKASLSDGNHKITTVPEAGLAGKTNGAPLNAAESIVDVFITLDQGLPYQQNLTGRKIAIIIIRAKSNRLEDLLPHAQTCRNAIARSRPGEIRKIG